MSRALNETARDEALLPAMDAMLTKQSLADSLAPYPCCPGPSRLASPTTMGKELASFLARLELARRVPSPHPPPS